MPGVVEISTRTVDAFVTLNLQARYTGFGHITLVLGAENALDEALLAPRRGRDYLRHTTSLAT